MGFPVGEIGIRDAHAAPALADIGFRKSHDAIGALERESFEEHGVDQREDRGIGADAQGQRNYHDSGEGSVLCQHAESEAHVL